jgi:hypothetical protein
MAVEIANLSTYVAWAAHMERTMTDRFEAEIDRLKESIKAINALIQHASGNTLKTFKCHRDWDLRILSQLMTLRR